MTADFFASNLPALRCGHNAVENEVRKNMTESIAAKEYKKLKDLVSTLNKRNEHYKRFIHAYKTVLDNRKVPETSASKAAGVENPKRF